VGVVDAVAMLVTTGPESTFRSRVAELWSFVGVFNGGEGKWNN